MSSCALARDDVIMCSCTGWCHHVLLHRMMSSCALARDGVIVCSSTGWCHHVLLHGMMSLCALARDDHSIGTRLMSFSLVCSFTNFLHGFSCVKSYCILISTHLCWNNPPSSSFISIKAKWYDFHDSHLLIYGHNLIRTYTLGPVIHCIYE